MVEVARFFMKFTQHESCEACRAEREPSVCLKYLKNCSRRGNDGDLDNLEEIAGRQGKLTVRAGQDCSKPVLTTLKYFRDEYVAHIVDKKCPAGVYCLQELLRRP